jgi:error-prone DNA polymerase
MPEQPAPKTKPQVPLDHVPRAKGPYAELHVTSNFSFLRGGSHPEELVARAAELGCKAVAITDINSLAGIVRAHVTAREAGIQLIVGCHLQVKRTVGMLASPAPDESLLSLLVYPTDRAAYGRLCRLLTYGKRKAAKGKCNLTLQDVIDHNAGLLAVALPPPLLTDEFAETVKRMREVFDGDRLSLAAACLYDGRNKARLAELAAFSKSTHVPLVATNDVHYHNAKRQPLQDVLTCIRLGCTVAQGGFALFANAERHLKGPEEMARLFKAQPQALHRTLQIAERAAGFSLSQLKYEYPSEVCPPGKDMMQHLVDRTWEGATGRYPSGVPESVRLRLEHEFRLIKELNYPAYFLTVDDIVAFARSQGILCQGRGAAANSAVCYCLGITAVDPARIDLLVERFISKERNEPPDIDIDFEHERREEVIQYIYKKYGRERAALTAEVISYRRRSAVREVGKAMGLSLDCVDRLAKAGDWWENGVIDEPRLRELGLDPRDATIRQTVQLANELIGFPRHLSQHVGGFVITQGPLCEMVPVENAAMPDRTVIEWDKDDIDEMQMLKVDVLGLGMLTCIRKAIDLVNQWGRTKGGKGDLQFHTVPAEDPAVYDMLCKADSRSS